MNILSSILDKENINYNSKLTILWGNSDNEYFNKFIQKLNHNLISIDHLYYGDNIPNLVICNNKISQIRELSLVSIRYHCPLIVIDHNPKTNYISTENLEEINNINMSYKIALSKEISKSWGIHYDQILSYNDTQDSLDIWNNLLHNISMGLYQYE
jgi:hypothetical protein